METTKNIDELKEYREKLSKLTKEEMKQRDLYLKKLGPRPKKFEGELYENVIRNHSDSGVLQGPTTMKASLDKPWLYKYTDEEIMSKVDNKSFYGFLYDSCNLFPNEIAFDFFGVKKSKRELFQEICRVEDMLVNEKDIKKGDLVCIAPLNQPESVYIIYALNKIGAKVSIIDPRANAESLKNDLLESEITPKLFIASLTAKEEYDKIKDIIKVESTIYVSPFESHPSKITKNLSKFIDKIKNGKIKTSENYNIIMKKYLQKKYSMEKVKEYEKSSGVEYDFIMHTGGTTGVHKGVELTGYAFNNTVYEHNALMDEIVFRGDKLVNPMPQFITYGLTTMHLSLCKGFEMQMLLLPTPKFFTKAIINNKCRIAFGGPVHWEGFEKNKLAKKSSLEFLRVAVAGGEKINLTTKEELNKFFKERKCSGVLIDGYGLSEVTGAYCVAVDENTIGSQGQPFQHNNAGIFDRDKSVELNIGETGELYVSSESMMNKYHMNESETNRVFTDNLQDKFLKTGDAAFINEYGEINIVGRYKRIFVCGVDKVYQETMEEQISELPFVQKCVITRIPVYDENLKAVPKAHIILKDEYVNKISQNDIEKSIVNYVATKISKNVIPRYFEIQETIDYTPNGKVDFQRMTIRDQVELNKKYPNVVKPFEEVDQYASGNINQEERIKKR